MSKKYHERSANRNKSTRTIHVTIRKTNSNPRNKSSTITNSTIDQSMTLSRKSFGTYSQTKQSSKLNDHLIHVHNFFFFEKL